MVKVKGVSEPATITLKAMGGVPDKKFADADYKFLYVPVTVKGTHNVGGKPYSKVWLNQNLGADYAKVGPGLSARLGGTSKDDYKAYGSIFQYGRQADGHELMTWADGNSKDWSVNHRTNPDIPYMTKQQLKNTEIVNPCPQGFHIPSVSDLKDLHEAMWGSRYLSKNIYDDTTILNLPTTGSMFPTGEKIYHEPGNTVRLWLSTAYDEDNWFALMSNPTSTEYSDYVWNRSWGFGVRCVKD